MAVNTQGFGIQLATGGFSLEANTIFSSYALALAYAKSSAAYEGKVISVTSGAEKGAYIVEAIGENASLKKVGSDVDLSNYVTKDQLTNVYTYKGSKDNYSDLPNNDSEVKPVAGDVWNVVNEYTSTVDGKYYPAGTNWVWNGSEWDAQGGSIDLSGYATVEALNAVSEAATNGIAGVASDLQTTNAEVAKKVTAQDGYSLISEEKLALIDTNAADIQALEDKNLDSRISTLEGMFKDGENNIDLSQINSTISEHTTKISSLETSKADKSTVDTLSNTVNGYGERLSAAESANAQQTTDISNLSTKVSGLETNHGNAITGLTTTVEGHTTTIGTLTSDVNAIKGDYLKAADIAGKLDASVYEAKVSELEQADADNLQAAKDYADGAAETALESAKAYADEKTAAISNLATKEELKAVSDKANANASAIEVLNGTGEGSVSKQVADAIAGVVANADEDFDTLKEVADWIASDTTGAAKMQSDIATLMGDSTKEGSVAKAIKDAVDAEAAIARAAEEANASAIDAIEADYLKVADKTELSNAIAAEKTRAEGVESNLEARLAAVEGDYLKSADKTELQQADADNLAAAKAYADSLFEWEEVE